MKPRVFISSTYYDLKYVRENLLRFIEKKYEFEAVIFERGNIPYDYEKSIGESCYLEVERCNMMILIVGSKYGTIDKSVTEEENYLSYTQREYRAAIRKKIPVFIFIEKSVFIEYEVYKKNHTHGCYTPVYVDNISIFNFISELSKSPIQKFERIEEIERYLTEQWTGWFGLYLENLENKLYDNISTKLNNTLDTVEKLKKIIDEMAKKTLDQNQMDKIRCQEIEIDLKNYAELISECLFFESDIPKDGDFESFCSIFVEVFCNISEMEAFNNTKLNRFNYFEGLIERFNNKIMENMKIKTIDFNKMFKNNNKTIELLDSNVQNKEIFIEYLIKEIKFLGE